jgi:hypothetical protein
MTALCPKDHVTIFSSVALDIPIAHVDTIMSAFTQEGRGISRYPLVKY